MEFNFKLSPSLAHYNSIIRRCLEKNFSIRIGKSWSTNNGNEKVFTTFSGLQAVLKVLCINIKASIEDVMAPRCTTCGN